VSAKNFLELTGELTFRLVLDDDMTNTLDLAGINVDDWIQETEITETAKKYFKLRKEVGHLYARNQLIDKINWIPRCDIPLEIDGLKYEYNLHRRNYFVLAQNAKIAKDPQNADKYASEILDFHAKTVSIKDLRDCVPGVLTGIEKKITEGKIITKIPGWEILSNQIGGFNEGRLIMVLADTGFGKTTLAINLAIAAHEIAKILYLNMEMIEEDFVTRVLVAKNHVQYAKLYSEGPLSLKVTDFRQGFLITDGTDLSMDQIVSAIKNKVRADKIKFAFVDYDQKIILQTDRNLEEWRALQRAMIKLESIAKAENICVVVLAQTNREGEISGSRRSTFPASTVLRFYEDKDGDTLIEAVKNRFGPQNAKIKVGYDTKSASISEHGISEKPIYKKKELDL